MKDVLILGILILVLVPEINSQNTDSPRYGMNGVYAELYIVRHDFSEGFVSVNFEFGIGPVFRIEHYIDPYVPDQFREWFFDLPAILVPLMYRYQKSNGLFFRGGVNLFLSWPTIPSPSLSIGYKF